jgi:hypothetical protein
MLWVELGLLFAGLYLLFGAKPSAACSSLKYEVRGWPRRIIIVLCLLPIPLSVAAGFVMSILMAAQGRDPMDQSNFRFGWAIEGGILLACVVAMVVIHLTYRTPIKGRQGGNQLASETADANPER